MFFESYYRPGTVTVGFDTTVISEIWNADKTSLTLNAMAGGKSPTALICLAAGQSYTFTVNGKPTSARQVTSGAYEIAVPIGDVTIEIH